MNHHTKENLDTWELTESQRAEVDNLIEENGGLYSEINRINDVCRKKQNTIDSWAVVSWILVSCLVIILVSNLIR